MHTIYSNFIEADSENDKIILKTGILPIIYHSTKLCDSIRNDLVNLNELKEEFFIKIKFLLLLLELYPCYYKEILSNFHNHLFDEKISKYDAEESIKDKKSYDKIEKLKGYDYKLSDEGLIIVKNDEYSLIYKYNQKNY